MLTLIKTILWLISILFIASLFIYFFNLDMKTMTIIEPILNRHYDRIKRDRKI